MKNIRPLNTDWRIFALLFAACSLLFLLGCRSPMEPNIAESETGKGTLLLAIREHGVGRTILPEISMNDFVSFSLAFVAEDAGVPNVYDIWTIGSGEIGLVPGTWDLHITAYLLGETWEDLRPAASGSLLGIEVPSGGTVAGNVVLSPIRGGSGTFSWGNINFPGGTITATMEITCVGEGDVPFSQTFYFIGGAETPPSSLSLYTGQYRVTFTLYGADGERMVVSAILHIYQNMESILPMAFIPSNFPSSLLDIVLGSWNGSYWDFVRDDVTPWCFAFLGIEGIDGGNFDDIVDWFDYLSTPTTIPNDLGGLKALVDAAIIVMARGVLSTGNYGSRSGAESAITRLVRNGTEIRFAWPSSDTVRVQLGDYEVEIVFDDDIRPDLLVPGDSLADQFTWLQAFAQSGGFYLIEVTNDTSLAPQWLDFPGGSDITVTLRGDGPMRTVSLSGSGSLFWVGGGVTLVLDDSITLNGIHDNTHPLVWVSYGGSLVMNAGSRIVGNTNIGAGPRGAGVNVAAGGVFTMNGGEISNNHSTDYATAWPGGGGVLVSSSGYADTDARFTMNGGTITGNTTVWQGGGVAIYHGTFVMYDGSITGNTSYSGGGGVFVADSGTFAMYGGAISNNHTAEWGGGVFAQGSFTMYTGATISGNTASAAGGAYASWVGTFVMYGGAISNNHTTGWGGAVIVSGEETMFTMHGGEIFGNTGYSGGAVDVIHHSTFAMHGGEISDHTASRNGGAVNVNGYGTFTMSGGDILGNTANAGGGVYVGWNGTFVMGGGTISNNHATGWPGGGGVTVSGETAMFTMNVGATISGNTSGGGGGGVSVAHSGTFAMNGGTISNNDTTGWPGGGGVIVRGGDSSFTMHGGAISGNTSLPIAGGVSIDGGTFTMHGGAISGNTANPNADDWSSGGGVRIASTIVDSSIVAYGTFTMYGGEISDNIAATIPGGWTSGGGLTVTNTSTFTMRGGTISDNEASAGAGVHVEGNSTFTMQNGEIFENTASQNGGAVNIGGNSVFAMQNGEIFGNTSLQNGGGVRIATGSTFAMHGGEIFDNTALVSGGGVRVDSGGVFQISNGVIHGSNANQSLRNTAPSGAALWGMAEHGTFPADVFSRTGDLITTNNTVNVANGVALQGGIPQGGQVIDLTPAAGNYLGVITATGVPFALLITDAGEFVELHIDSYNEVHGLDLMFGPHSGFHPGIVDLYTAGLVTFGGTYTITMEGRAAWLPEGDVRIVPWPAGHPDQPGSEYQGSRVALSAGELEFYLEFEFTPQAGDDYGRVRILIADVATTIILTSVVIRNAGGDVVWSLAEALMSPL